MNKDFDNNILDFTKRKKALKLILFLLVISLVVLVVQLFFRYRAIHKRKRYTGKDAA